MKVMGIVNVTPDSFSDGGAFLDPEEAIAHGRALAAQGADVLDVGGASTRPGAEPVSPEVELARVLPVIEGLAGIVPVSIDTDKAEVAGAAIAAGATMVNDVTALRGDPDMAACCAEAGVEVVLMHMLGNPRTMQDDPRYGDVVAEVAEFLEARAEVAVASGIARERLWIDPGIGFGKTVDHNLSLLRHIVSLTRSGMPVMVGASRKSFIGRLDGDAPEDRRLGGTVAACLAAQAGGAAMVRVHDVEPVSQALRMAEAIAAAR